MLETDVQSEGEKKRLHHKKWVGWLVGWPLRMKNEVWLEMHAIQKTVTTVVGSGCC